MDGEDIYRLSGSVRGDGKGRTIFKGHTAVINSIAVTPDGRVLASADDDGDIRVWSVVTGKKLVSLKGHNRPVRSVAFAVVGRTTNLGLRCRSHGSPAGGQSQGSGSSEGHLRSLPV